MNKSESKLKDEEPRTRFVQKPLQVTESHPNVAGCQNCRFLGFAIVLRVDAHSHRVIE